MSVAATHPAAGTAGQGIATAVAQAAAAGLVALAYALTLFDWGFIAGTSP